MVLPKAFWQGHTIEPRSEAHYAPVAVKLSTSSFNNEQCRKTDIGIHNVDATMAERSE
jgi:hypothetical protein